MRRVCLALTLLSLTSACTPDDDATTTADGSTTDPTGQTTDEPTSGGGDLNDVELGASASAACRAAGAKVAELTQAADAAAAQAAYAGDLQGFVQALDAANAREDDAAISAALAAGSDADLAAARARVQVAFAREFRNRLTEVSEGAEDKYAVWDEAHCVYEAALASLADEADGVTWAGVDETIAADIEAALQAGHDGISGAAPATAQDDWRVPPSKQVAEKSLFRAAHRVIVELAGEARADADPVAARRALELFGMVEDRLEERNTPGIQQIKDILGGDPASIDADAVLWELDLAFAKRTRRYADAAIEAGEVGTPPGYTGAVEGHTYAKLILPGMLKKLADANPAAYLGEWAGYADLVKSGEMMDALTGVSQRLVDQTCAYQTALGIAGCTGDADETE
jgi:hypothetical protein